MTNNGEPHHLLNQKHKSNRVRLLSDFRNINKQLKQNLHPISKINEILLKLEGFQYATSLDLNMGYYHIRLRKNASNLCTIITPRGKYWYKRLPMGVANSPENFQQKMNDFFHGFEFIRVYIDHNLIPTKGYWTYHTHGLE